MTKPNRFARFAAAFGLSLVVSVPAFAQGLFSPVITVNDQVVSGYEIEQRARLLTVMRAPGDPIKTAREQLIEDRLKSQAAMILGIEPSEEGLDEAMEEFAQRAKMDKERFIKALAQEGVSKETYRDFVLSNLIWRDVVRARFLNRAQVSEEEIDRAMAAANGTSGVQVLLSEIIIPVTPQTQEQVQNEAARISEIETIGAFARDARKFSAARTAADGGRIKWMPLSNLPEQIRPLILGLAPGEVTDPIPIPNAIALFQMRAISETELRRPAVAAIEYAVMYLPGGRNAETLTQAEAIRGRVDRCDDLYGENFGRSDELLQRETRKPGDIPQGIALELAKLDKGEISTSLTSENGQNLMLIMMCGRTPVLAAEASREDITVALRNQRLSSFADSYLEQLKSEADIIEQ